MSHLPLTMARPAWEVQRLEGGAHVAIMRRYLSADLAASIGDELRSTLPWAQYRMRRDAGGKAEFRAFPRLECWYGGPEAPPYTYSGLPRTPYRLDQHELLTSLLEGVQAEVDKLPGEPPRFDSVFCNLYRKGSDHIGWHSDDEPVLGDPARVVIASLSFGATRRFLLRRKDTHTTRHAWDLDAGDLLVMGRRVQSAWKHRAPPSETVWGWRVNLTFRRVGGV